MKSIFISIFWLLYSFTYGQNMNYSVQLTSLNTTYLGSNQFTISGNVVDNNGVLTANMSTLGDSLFYVEEGILYTLVMVGSKTVSGSRLTATYLSVPPHLVTAPSQEVSGIICLARKNTQGYCSPAPGISDIIKSAMINRMTDVLQKAVEIYQYVGTVGVLPSVNPPTINQYLAKNTANELYFWNGTSWILLSNTTNLLITNNTWLGKNTFIDTAVFNKGLRTDGTINSAAVIIKGVQQSQVTSISTNTTIDGTYNTIIINTATGDVSLTLPPASSANIGWQYKVSKTGSNLARIIRPSQSPITLYSNEFTLSIKNNNSTTWEIE